MSAMLSVLSVLSMGMLDNSVSVCSAWLFNIVSEGDFLVLLDWHLSVNIVCCIDEDFSWKLSGDSVGNLNSVCLINVDGSWTELKFLVVMVVWVFRQRVRLTGFAVREGSKVCTEVSWSKSEMSRR